MNQRQSSSRLIIGAYCLAPYARTRHHIHEIAQCGIDMMIGVPNDRTVLDHFAEFGVGAVVSGVVPGWFGGRGDNADTMETSHPLSAYEVAAQTFEDHPAIWGIDIGDEPSALDFPHYGKVFALVEKLFPMQFAYLNIYPGYGMLATDTPEEVKRQHGTETYQQYVDRYCECVPSAYLCHDFYLYSASPAAAYRNFSIVADACQRTGRRMWTVLQVNSHQPEVCLSENQLRFQACLAMTFGTELISWACYTAGWWHNQVLDAQGNKTEQYGKLQNVNRELHHLGEDYMRYRRVHTYLIGDATSHWQEIGTVSSLDLNAFRAFCVTEGGCIAVGEMVSRQNDGTFALMLCGADDPMDVQPRAYTVRFRADGYTVRAVDGEKKQTLLPDDNGWVAVEMRSNRGMLLIAEK